MKKVIFLGSRVHVYNAAIELGLEFEQVFALKGSILETELQSNNQNFSSFSMKDASNVLSELYNSKFDILISNGCPILFPVKNFQPNQILINIHPTYLPHLQGKTPLNGIFYLGYEYYGATMHFIDEGIDTGKIIYQHREDLTPDIDLGLVYFLSMELEGEVFKMGWQLLVESDFRFEGKTQSKGGTYFNRTEKKRTIDFSTMDSELILRKIKSFGLGSQGCYAQIENKDFLVIEAERIVHQPLLEKSKYLKPGETFLKYDQKLLVKAIDGLIKVTRFREISTKNLGPARE